MVKTQYEKVVAKVGITTIIWNLILTLAKVIGGIFAKSSSLISDGIHSASDVFSTIIVIIGAKMGHKAADKDHPFGHERLESVASMILSMLLGATALILIYSGVNSIIKFIKDEEVLTTGNVLYVALSFAIASIIIKGWMYFYTKRNAKKINSTSLKADAFHHLTDSLSSIGSALGIMGMIIGGKWAILDPIASLIIGVFIIKVSIDIAKVAINQVVDKAADDGVVAKINDLVLTQKGVEQVNSLKTRMFGSRFYVEIEIAVDGNLSVFDGHEIAKNVHDQIEQNFPDVKHCMVHVDPLRK
jgi:cation diffusion facilitator family transporter